MAKMKAAMAAVLVMEKEGIGHILARHVEAASSMAEGYTRARPITSSR